MLPWSYAEGPGAGRPSRRSEAGDGVSLLGLLHGFVTEISKTDVENEERLHALIDDAEVPRERLAKLFEPEVLPPETSSGAGEDGGGRDVD